MVDTYITKKNVGLTNVHNSHQQMEKSIKVQMLHVMYK